MYSTIVSGLTKNQYCQFRKRTKTSFWYSKRDCPSRSLSISGPNFKTISPLVPNDEPNNYNELGSMPGGKIFKENEAEFHHKIMEDCPSYSSTIFKQDPQFTKKYQLKDNEFCDLVDGKNWKDKPASTLAMAFASLGVYSNLVSQMTLEDERLDLFVCAFLKKCPLFSDEELMDCLIALQHWAPANSVRDEQFLNVWKALDQVCHNRYIDWSHDKVLYVVDLWYQIRLTRLSIFVFKALKKISNKCEE